MRECPWCGRMNLNVYVYCQGCGRGFAGPPWQDDRQSSARRRRWWPFRGKKVA